MRRRFGRRLARDDEPPLLAIRAGNEPVYPFDDFESVLVENHNGPGPFGSKGTGEGGLLPVAAAIGNALYQATGLRLYDLPLTPEKVWRGLRSA